MLTKWFRATDAIDHHLQQHFELRQIIIATLQTFGNQAVYRFAS